MRASLIALAVVALSALSIASPSRAETKPMNQPVNNDEAAILDLHERFATAWSSGSVEALLAMFAPDAMRVGAAGDVQRTPAELRAAFDRLLTGRFKGAKVTLDRGSVRMLSADYAIWQAPMTIDPGAGKPPIHGYAVDVMKKVGGAWLILETHPKLFPPPPPVSR